MDEEDSQRLAPMKKSCRTQGPREQGEAEH